uniref:patatin-like phospholipase family protein n=1 Tax=Hydrogenophaga sp. OTU3427 TaxID=3043856 RepID=UPI00313E4368
MSVCSVMLVRPVRLSLALAALVLAGCATPIDTRPKLDLNNEDPAEIEALFKPERSHLKERPKIGLALAGGGTKAAVFAHGVLHGLNDAKVLQHVDVISSVSGGSYAAMWYFTKHLEAQRHGFPVQQIFEDCWAAWRLNPATDSKKDDWVEYSRIFASASKQEKQPCKGVTHYEPGDPYRFQSHLIRYPDLFRTEYTTITGDSQDAPVGESLGLLGRVLAEFLVGWTGFRTGLIDAYQAGIERTWGLNPVPRNAAAGNTESKDSWKYTNDNKTATAEFQPRMDATSATFADMRALYKGSNPPPMWVLQSTIGDKAALPNMDTVFEISPFIQGSSLAAAKRTSNPEEFHPEIQQLPSAVRASAAFADSQGVQPGLLKSLMVGISNNLLPSSRWGVDITLKDGKTARLSDGGGSDNLGLMSLVRRRLDDIIIADSAQDKRGTMQDLCWAQKALKQEELIMTFDDLENFDQLCQYHFDRSNPEMNWAYNVSMWLNPVVRGKITSEKTKKVTRLWLIKPGWNQQDVRKAYNDPDVQCGPMRPADDPQRPEVWSMPPKINCGMVLYYANNAEYKTPHGDYMTFPQDGTVSAVLNFSSWKIHAYRELGRFNAGHLRFNAGALEMLNTPRLQKAHRNDKERPGPGLPAHWRD